MSRIFAIDLGAWSVKVVIAHAGLRHAALTEIVERPVPPGDEPHERRAAKVLAAIIGDLHLEKDTGYLVVGGSQVFVHVLEFGFKTARRQDLDRVVGGELEGIVPVDLEDLVYASEPLAALPEAAPIEPGAPQARGRLAAPTTGTRVLTYSMRASRAKELLELTAGAGAEARGLMPVAVLARLAERTPSMAGPGAVAVVDVGHEHTHVVVAQAGKPVFSRTIARGGRAVTDAIARNWRLATGEAENAKHSDGFIASAANPAPSEAWARVSGVVVAEIGPWTRELRQSLASCRAKTGITAGRVLLVGGGSRLRGLASYVAGELNLPVTTLEGSDLASLAGAKLAESAAVDSAALAIAAAHDLGGGRPSLDLRQGALAFKVDMSFIKTKLTQVAAAALLVLAFAGASAYASLRNLKKADKLLTERVGVESTEVFHKPLSVKELENATNGAVAAGESPLPKMSAYDVLLQISDKMPTRDKVTLDVTNLEIKDDKINLTGSAKTPEEIDQVEAALKNITCVKDISRGQTTTGADKLLTFQFNVRAECM